MQKPVLPLEQNWDPRNYRIALEAAKRNFAACRPRQMSQNSGCPFDAATSSFLVTCLDHSFSVSYPDGMVRYIGTELQPYFALQLIMVNHLVRADGTPLSYGYISYRELDGGNVYYDAFHKTAVQPLKTAFGSNPERLLLAAGLLGGLTYNQGSGISVLLYFLPRLPVIIRIWPGDEEFPPGATILFDATANHYLHTEDLAAMDIVTRLLVKLNKKIG